MKLEDLERIPRNYLTAVEVGKFLGCDPMLIRYMAKNDPDALGFPVIRLKSRTKIPKDGFIHYCRYGRVNIQIQEA